MNPLLRLAAVWAALSLTACAAFLGPPQADGATTASVVNARYDPDSRTLVAFNKGRGIGDCGVAQTWAWTGGAFALVLEQEMEDCIGLPPDEWPVSWRSR